MKQVLNYLYCLCSIVGLCIMANLVYAKEPTDKTLLNNGIDPNVVVSIRPLYSLVSYVMGDTGKPTLLIDKNRVHDYAMNPSDLKLLSNAKIIFFIDNYNFETFLSNVFMKLPNDVIKVSLLHLDGIRLLKLRKDGVQLKGVSDYLSLQDFEALSNNDRDHAESTDRHHHQYAYDPHIWMDIENTIIMVKAITNKLSALYPSNQKIYQHNAQELITKLQQLDKYIGAKMRVIQDRQYIVTHDAYQYFTHQYNMAPFAILMVDLNQNINANTLHAIHQQFKEKNITCILNEDEYAKLIVIQDIVQKYPHTKQSILSPLGWEFDLNKQLYFNLMYNIINQMTDCLVE